MNIKSLQIIIVFAVLLSAVGFFLWKNSSSEPEIQEKTGHFLVSQEQIQNLQSVIIRNQSESLDFETTDLQWVVKSLNYPLDRQKLQKLLLDMNQAKLVSLVSSKKEHHKRFAVDLAENSLPTDGILIELHQAESSLKVILGKSREKGGRYVRYADSPHVYLIADSLEVSVDGKDWIKKQLLDIKDEQVKKIQLTHEGQSTAWQRDDKDADWQLENAEGQLKQDVIKTLAGALQEFDFENIAPDTTVLEEQSIYEVTLFDGRQITISFVKQDDNYLLTAQMQAGESPSEELQKEVTDFQNIANNRVFQVSSWKAEKMIAKEYLEAEGQKE